jgi:dTDP-4-amino-4,6-dideoxygalactose transaminase
MKTRMHELAAFEGVPAFAEVLHVGRPNLGDRGRLLARIHDILNRNWLSNNGPLVQELEQRIAELSGARHCIAMCNGTVALEIASRGLGMRGEVIVPAFTFVATVHALKWQEITPIFCDVDPVTHTLDPEQVRRLITPRTTGILGVHLWGNPCHLDALKQIADEHGLKLLYDGSHAIACSFGGQGLGSYGDATVCSFHATKVLNTFEGGAVLTNNDALAGRLRLMKNFGFAGMDRVIYLGINGKMSEVNAAMGLTNLESLEEFVAVNRRHDWLYRELLQGLPGVRIVPHAPENLSNYHYLVLEIDQNLAGLSRDELLGVLHAENIRARRYFYPGCHRMEPYRTLYPQVGGQLPVTEDLADRVLCLPTGAALSDDDVPKVASVIRVALSNAEEVSRHLQEHQVPWLKDRP